MDLLARREHGRAELEQKLRRKGVVDAASLDRVLDQLESDGLLSEQRFLDAYIRSRINAGFGPLKISAELRQKNIADCAARLALEGYHDCWQDVMLAARHKKFGHQGSVKDRESLARQFRFLLYRGFPHDLIQQALFKSAE